ncbi:hypothetical protein F2Q69_00023495 [Brassica cretica]|uniref:Uncharacterized protein n=1 Tax=Brassica cretica TaxID=69181 RepID=A0A8S9PZR8_BRACR|nr:hypothetical protein F2Q69_00023495 [Brassica cretica]
MRSRDQTVSATHGDMDQNMRDIIMPSSISIKVPPTNSNLSLMLPTNASSRSAPAPNTTGELPSPYQKKWEARLMQGSISVYRLNSFRHILEESNVYELNGFDVAKCNPAYKFDETPVSIRRRAYCFVGVADTSENPQGMLQGHSFMSECFDGVAADLDKILLNYVVEPMVVIATNINSKFVGGKTPQCSARCSMVLRSSFAFVQRRLLLNATSCTFILTTTVELAVIILKMALMRDHPELLLSMVGLKKVESVTLSELNTHGFTASPEEPEFLCTAVVDCIDTAHIWCYFSFQKCYRKLQRGFSAVSCYACRQCSCQENPTCFDNPPHLNNEGCTTNMNVTGQARHGYALFSQTVTLERSWLKKRVATL